MASHREERGKAGTAAVVDKADRPPQRQRPHPFPTAAQGAVKAAPAGKTRPGVSTGTRCSASDIPHLQAQTLYQSRTLKTSRRLHNQKHTPGLPLLCLGAQPCPTLCDPIDCSPPGSSVQGSLQARVLEWVATPLCIPAENTRQARNSTPGPAPPPA